MKKRLCLLLVCLLFMGCSNNPVKYEILSSSDFDNNRIETTVIEDKSTEISTEILTEEVEEAFSLSLSLNAFDEELGNALGFKKDLRGKNNVMLRAIIFSGKKIEEIPCKIWLLADGKFIDFSVDNDNQQKEHIVNVNNGNFTDFELSFEGNRDVSMVTIVLLAFPDEIPELEIGLYGSLITYSIVNTECNNNFAPKQEDDDYINGLAKDRNRKAIYIDTKNSANIELQYYKDFVANKENPLYVKFSSDGYNNVGDPANIHYALFLIKDGNIADKYLNDGCDIVYTPDLIGEKKTRMYVKALPEEYYDDKGLHYFQAVAVPYCIDNAMYYIDSDSISVLRERVSEKIRVLVD